MELAEKSPEPPGSDEQNEDPNLGNRLLQLPTELILEIGQHARPAERVLLSQTCRTLRLILQEHGTAQNLRAILRPRRYLAFLYAVARDRRDVWVCDLCYCLHEIRIIDTPTVPYEEKQRSIVYGHAHYQRRLTAPQMHSGFSKTSERHIQLSLRLSRLRASCTPFESEYLRLLLQPYSTAHYERGSMHNAECYPKVVGIKGSLHYMVRTVVPIKIHHLAMFPPWTESHLRLCRHQELNRQRQGPGIVNRILPVSPYVAIAGPAWYDATDSETAAVIRTRGGCRRCLTDYSLAEHDMLGENITLTAWQYLGTETTPGIVPRQPLEFPFLEEPDPYGWDPIVPWGSDRLIPRRSGWVRDTYENAGALLPAPAGPA